MKNLALERERIESDAKRKLLKIEESVKIKSEKIAKQAADKLKKIDELEKQSNKIIPIFFASDANYLPYLSVALNSLKDNANKNYVYKIYILHNGITQKEQLPVKNFEENGFFVEFINVSEKLEEVKNGLQLRDYYTGATYYRIFIANMFPEYDKALYLDSDIIVLGDISKLYNYDLKNNLVGAVCDRVVSGHHTFQSYSREVLGIEPQNYFNAGILLMNLKKFRTDGFYESFKSLLSEYKFCVAQDQDYLNVICKDKVKYLPYSWNTMPVGGEGKNLPNLIHYNLTLKPWHYADIPYAKHFWKYAQVSSYSNEIRRAFGEHTLDKKLQDDKTEAHLLALAQAEIDREDNFIKARKNRKADDFNVFENVFSDDIFCLEDQPFNVIGAKN
ncbi:MAG: glycosyltransferase family 8 protein [Clostridia bacterium]|nr:glycosyltransferase family 8 protein [Clostridia bacterium]